MSEGSRKGQAEVDARVDWRMAGGDRAHSSDNPWEYTLTASSVKALQLQWHTTLQEDDSYSDSITELSTYDNSGYTCTALGEVTKFELSSGDIDWQANLQSDGPPRQGYCGEGSVYNDGTGYVWAGAARFSDSNGASQSGGIGPIADGDPVPYAGEILSGGTPIDCNDARAQSVQDGSTLWDISGGACGSVLIDGTFYYSDGANVVAVDAVSKKPLWTWPDDPNAPGINALGADSGHLIVNEGGSIVSLDPATGKVVWSAPSTDAQGSTFTVGDNAVYYTSGAGSATLTARSLTDGEILWRAPASQVDPTSGFRDYRIEVADGLLYTSIRHSVAVFNATTGALVDSFTVDPSVLVNVVVAINGNLYVGTSAGIYDYAAPGAS